MQLIRTRLGTIGTFLAVLLLANKYGGEPSPRRLQKYVRVRP